MSQFSKGLGHFLNCVMGNCPATPSIMSLEALLSLAKAGLLMNEIASAERANTRLATTWLSGHVIGLNSAEICSNGALPVDQPAEVAALFCALGLGR